jgi:UDP-N-acetylmuramate dehydrogenase
MRADFDLQPFNTFGLHALARYYFPVYSEHDLLAILMDQRSAHLPFRVIGGGSNLLLTSDLEAIVLHMFIHGIEVMEETETEVVIRVGAGVEWHALVVETLSRNWAGLENLSLIPGKVGAAPIQNIGAYGVEFKEVCEKVEAMHLATGRLDEFTALQCKFGYRDSLFKQEAKNRYAITRVWMRLRKTAEPNLTYAALRQAVEAEGLTHPTIHDVSRLVTAIRSSKLPDPRQIGNAGSFFKNPVVAAELVRAIQEAYPHMPVFAQENGNVKVPAGWLIEQSGWKGYRRGDAGIHDKQALVVVNHGSATGQELRALAFEVQADVQKRFGIELEPEVNIW